MSTFDSLVTGSWGSVIVIAAMAVVTYLCRAAGAIIMSRMRITPRIERGLRALPGSIILATILPVTIDHGWPAITALAVATVAMVLTRQEVIGLTAGLGALSIIRAFL